MKFTKINLSMLILMALAGCYGVVHPNYERVLKSQREKDSYTEIRELQSIGRSAEAKNLFLSLRSDEQIDIYIAGRMTRRVHTGDWMSEVAAADVSAFLGAMHTAPYQYRPDLFLVLQYMPPGAKEEIAKDACLLQLMEGMADDNMSISIVKEIRALSERR